MIEIVVADIGGTHARFALAEIGDGRVTLTHETTLPTEDHASLRLAWQAFAREIDRPLPRQAGIALACPVGGGDDLLRLTSNPWTLRRSRIADELGLDRFTLVNDFGAVGHAVARVGAAHLRHLCGPDRPLPEQGVVTIVGPGTGLGVGQLIRHGAGHSDTYHIVETEGGHVGFAPVDDIDDAILAHLRLRHGRVSAERVVSGPGLAAIHATLAAGEGIAVLPRDDKALWTAGLAGADRLAAAAIDRFCLALGSVAGDLALAQGAAAVVIAGGVGRRLADHLPRSGFARRFIAKGRFDAMMQAIPVKLITHSEPGLYGAAAAFTQEHDL